MIRNGRADRHWSLRVTFLFAMTLVGTALAIPTASAKDGTCDESGNYEVCTSYGNADPDADPVADLIIARKIKAKIAATATTPEDGDYIRVSMYQWETNGYGKEIAEALLDAFDAGVSVRVVMGDSNSDITKMLTDRPNPVPVTTCLKACMPSSDGVNHNKFFLIKKGDTKLVLQSSANLSTKQAQHAQNLLIVRDDEKLFSAYLDYWRRLQAGSWTYDGTTWADDDKARYGTNDDSRAYFYPMSSTASPLKDPLTGVLQNVTACSDEGDSNHNRIWIEASLFDSNGSGLEGRSEVVAELKRLRDDLGCDIKILVQKKASKESLINHGIGDSDVACDSYLHSKLLLIDAKYGGVWNKAVFVGSYNITPNSTYHSNDTMLRVINDWVAGEYVDHFKYMWTNANHDCEA